MFPHQFPNNKDTPLAGHASTAGLQSSPFAASSQAVCTNPLCSQVLLSQESAVSAPPPGGLGRKLPAEPVRRLTNMTLKPQHRAWSPHGGDLLWDPEPHLRGYSSETLGLPLGSAAVVWSPGTGLWYPISRSP